MTSQLRLAALVVQEPDASLDYFDVAPKVFLNLADLPATGLVQEGSRIRYRLVVAGDATAVDRFIVPRGLRWRAASAWKPSSDARPEIRSALDRAGRFLGLAALVSVVLAAVAVAMAARRHSERHLSGTAVMRCLGASQRTLVGIHVGELILLGLIACTLGVLIAYGLQWVIGSWLQAETEDFHSSCRLAACAAGIRRGHDRTAGLRRAAGAGAAPRVGVARTAPRPGSHRTQRMAGRADGLRRPGRAAVVEGGFGDPGTAMLLGIAGHAGGARPDGVADDPAGASPAFATARQPALRAGQRQPPRRHQRGAGVARLGLGLMALLLLTFVRTDLLDRWQLSLAADAPNRFIINVQEDQQAEVNEFMAEQKIAPPVLFPMIRGRLVSLNGKPTSGADYADDQEARRRAEREFNLSIATTLRDDNKVTAGEFWNGRTPATPELSVEERFAEQLGWKIGDRVGFRYRRPAFRRKDHQPAQRGLGKLPPQFLRDRLARIDGRLSGQLHHRRAACRPRRSVSPRCWSSVSPICR